MQAHPCPNCALLNPPGARYCNGCGLALGGAAAGLTVDPAQLRKLCAGCRTINHAGFRFCYHCGLALPDRLFAASQLVGDPAGFWARIVAAFIDAVLLIMAGILVVLLITGGDERLAFGDEFALAVIGSTLLAVFLSAAYYTLAVGRWGRTVGKLVMGLKVTRSDGSPLTYRRSLARYWACYLSLIPLGLGVLAILLSPQKRAWQDLIVDSRVLRVKA